MDVRFLYEDYFERGERKRKQNEIIMRRCNEITEHHPEAVSLFLAGVGVILVCLVLVFGISEITYRYRLGHWIEHTAVVDNVNYSDKYGRAVKCHYEIDGETRYGEVYFTNSRFYYNGDTITVYLNPSNKHQYIGCKGSSDEVTIILMGIVSLAIGICCFYLAYNAYTKHYLFKGTPLFSQKMAELGIDTAQYDDFYH